MDPQLQTPPPQPPQSPPVTPENSNRSFWKTLAIGMSIVSFGIALAVGGYILGTNKNKIAEAPTSQITSIPIPTPTPDETVGWKTYTNTQYGYSFKYPSELELIAFKSMVQIADKGLPPLDGNCTNIHIYPPIIEQVNESWISENRKSLKPDNTTSTPIVRQYTNSFNSLIKGYWFEKGSESIGKYIFANINGKYIEIGFPGCGAGDNYSTHPEVLEKMDQILSTFQFTN